MKHNAPRIVVPITSIDIYTNLVLYGPLVPQGFSVNALRSEISPVYCPATFTNINC